MKALSLFKYLVLLILFTSFLPGCSIFGIPKNDLTKAATIYERRGTDVIIEPNTGISIALTDAKFNDTFCVTSPPDIIVGKSNSFSLEDKGIKGGKSNTFAANDLGGRTPAVLISREILYRTCELISNLKLTKEQGIDVFKYSIQNIVDLSKTEITSKSGQKNITSSQLVSSVTDAAKIKRGQTQFVVRNSLRQPLEIEAPKVSQKN